MREPQEQEKDDRSAWKQRRKFLLIYYNTLSLFSVLAVFGLLMGIACDCSLLSLLFVLLFFVSLVNTLPRDHLCIVRNQCDTLALFASRNCPFASFLSFLVQFQPIRYHPHSRITVSHPSRLEGRPARVQRNTSHFVGGTLLLLSALPDFAESLHSQTRHPERVPDTLGWDHFWIVYVVFAVAYDG